MDDGLQPVTNWKMGEKWGKWRWEGDVSLGDSGYARVGVVSKSWPRRGQSIWVITSAGGGSMVPKNTSKAAIVVEI